jgi:hypothetical protein
LSWGCAVMVSICAQSTFSLCTDDLLSTMTFSGRRREWGGLRGSDERWGSDQSRRATRKGCVVLHDCLILLGWWCLCIPDVLCWGLLIPDMYVMNVGDLNPCNMSIIICFPSLVDLVLFMKYQTSNIFYFLWFCWVNWLVALPVVSWQVFIFLSLL